MIRVCLVRIISANLLIWLNLSGVSVAFVIWQICLPVLIKHIDVGFPSVYRVWTRPSTDVHRLSTRFSGHHLHWQLQDISPAHALRVFFCFGSVVVMTITTGRRSLFFSVCCPVFLIRRIIFFHPFSVFIPRCVSFFSCFYFCFSTELVPLCSAQVLVALALHFAPGTDSSAHLVTSIFFLEAAPVAMDPPFLARLSFSSAPLPAELQFPVNWRKWGYTSFVTNSHLSSGESNWSPCI